MVEIEDKLVSSELFSKQFVCNLSACKGACCVEGDTGAPLERDEIKLIEKSLDKIKPYMTAAGIEAVDEAGVSYLDPYKAPVTMLVEGKECAFVFKDEQGITKCAIEKAYRQGDIPFNKPVSCHLYPIRVTKRKNFESLNYDRWEICKDACTLGEELKVPVYRFLKEPIERAYGKTFYAELDKVAQELQKQEPSEKKENKSSAKTSEDKRKK
ncbi:MAG: DUF3109 family protein [Bacteroidetes bacterium]|nr:DUF3109 family protein [Bacteroidota bacterium]